MDKSRHLAPPNYPSRHAPETDASTSTTTSSEVSSPDPRDDECKSEALSYPTPRADVSKSGEGDAYTTTYTTKNGNQERNHKR